MCVTGAAQHIIRERDYRQTAELMTEQQARLRQYTDQQHLLLEVTRHIANSTNLSEVLPHILEGIARAIPADCVRLLVSTSGAQLYTLSFGPLAEDGVQLDEPLLALVTERGEIALVRGQDTSFDESLLPPAFESLFALPLRTRSSVHGMLWLGFGSPHALSDSEHTLLAILAGQAAIAIANARSFVAARQRHEWLAAVLAHTPDPVLVVDRDLRLQLANPAAQQILTSLGDKVVGQPLESLAEIGGLTALFAGDNAGHESDAPPVEYTLDDDRTYTPSISEVLTEDGEQTGWVLVLQDVTRFKRLHDNMSDFLSTVSHDMRTPLTYMKGYLDMLGMIGELNDKQREFVGKIAAGFVQITDMVEKILKAGRLDPMTGTYRLEREPCDVIGVLDEVVNNLTGPAHEKGLHLSHAVAQGIPVLNVDRGLIVSAFMNLAENAVKYTPEGGHIELELSMRNGFLVFRVSDDGLGINAQDQQKLFRRNVRIHRKEWKRVKGSGLGLFIVKNVAQRHGGDTWVESVEGDGSTFYFSIPLAGLNLIGGESREGVAVRAE